VLVIHDSSRLYLRLVRGLSRLIENVSAGHGPGIATDAGFLHFTGGLADDAGGVSRF
jgi:hypothetical protein